MFRSTGFRSWRTLWRCTACWPAPRTGARGPGAARAARPAAHTLAFPAVPFDAGPFRGVGPLLLLHAGVSMPVAHALRLAAAGPALAAAVDAADAVACGRRGPAAAHALAVARWTAALAPLLPPALLAAALVALAAGAALGLIVAAARLAARALSAAAAACVATGLTAARAAALPARALRRLLWTAAGCGGWPLPAWARHFLDLAAVLAACAAWALWRVAARERGRAR